MHTYILHQPASSFLKKISNLDDLHYGSLCMDCSINYVIYPISPNTIESLKERYIIYIIYIYKYLINLNFFKYIDSPP